MIEYGMVNTETRQIIEIPSIPRGVEYPLSFWVIEKKCPEIPEGFKATNNWKYTIDSSLSRIIAEQVVEAKSSEDIKADIKELLASSDKSFKIRWFEDMLEGSPPHQDVVDWVNTRKALRSQL